jgi:ribose transport system substrate-binding protein
MGFVRDGSLLALALVVGSGCGGSREAAKSVKFVGFDASPPLVEAMRQGQLQGVVVQNPYKMGQEGLKAVVAAIEKKAVEVKVTTGETMVTPENMDSEAVRPLLEPPKLAHSADRELAGKKVKALRVMVIPKGTTHEFWKTIHAGAVKAAEDLGNVEVVWQGPQKEDDRVEQIKLVQNAVAAGVDGIVLAPLDDRALVAPVEKAIAAGIPVVIIDSGLKSSKIASYVATDNYHGGVLAAERLADLLGGQGKIILMRYAEGSESTIKREEGFMDTIKKYPNITYLSNDQYAGATSDSAQKTARNLITRYRGEVDGIFCSNESATSGMLRVLKDAGLLASRAK